MRKFRAFTLIELLVVVAILALLIALLLPTLAKAKEEAKITKCLANLHAIGISLASYSAGNQDLMPEGFNWKYGEPHPNGTNFPNGKDANPWRWPSNGTDDRLALLWSDALYIDGDLKEWTNEGGHMDNNGTWYNPSLGYGVFQCPSHSWTVQPGFGASQANSDDSRISQGYGIAWCHCSYFEPMTDSAGTFLQPLRPVYKSFARNLNPNHIMVSEGDAQMSGWTQGGSSMGLGVTPQTTQYKIFMRHKRNSTYGGNYLMAGGQAEWSAVYGNYPSPWTCNISTAGVPYPQIGPIPCTYSPGTPAKGKPPHDFWAHP